MFSLALAAGLTLSPDNLTLFGNSMGAAGLLLLFLLPVGITVHLSTLHSFRVLHALSGDPIQGFQRMFGRRSAAILIVSGKLPFAVCASAGLVVSAGFVFNEVFVYWFPNFAFAYLLLALIFLLNLFGSKTALIAQVITIAAACIGMLILTGASLFNPSEVPSPPEMGVNFDYRYLAAAVIVLVGFDMGLYAEWNDRNSFSHRFRAMVMGLIGSVVLLALWGLATMAIVPPAKLESSTIPYMIMARKAFGQTGRFIMGAVVIFGVFAAVNAMTHSVSTMTAQLITAGRKPEKLASPLKTRVTMILITAGASALLMAMGYAGEPILETWIRASLVLWLIYYMTVNISAFRAVRNVNALTENRQASSVSYLKALSIAGTFLAAAGLVLLEPEPLDLLVFMVVIVTTVTIVMSGIDFYVGRVAQRIQEHQKVPVNHD